jgi:hypothetical protein
MAAYRIADEAAPSTLAHLAVNPLFPFLAVMLGGTWIGFVWFAVNSFAVGSPTRVKEIAWLVGGLVAATLLVVVMSFALGAGILEARHVPYAALVILVVKLAAAYAVHILQSRTIEIYQYYGGVLRNGLPIAIVAFIFGRRLLDSAPALARLVLQ